MTSSVVLDVSFGFGYIHIYSGIRRYTIYKTCLTDIAVMDSLAITSEDQGHGQLVDPQRFAIRDC